MTLKKRKKEGSVLWRRIYTSRSVLATVGLG
jgi:hypothetical protein